MEEKRKHNNVCCYRMQLKNAWRLELLQIYSNFVRGTLPSEVSQVNTGQVSMQPREKAHYHFWRERINQWTQYRRLQRPLTFFGELLYTCKYGSWIYTPLRRGGNLHLIRTRLNPTFSLQNLHQSWREQASLSYSFSFAYIEFFPLYFSFQNSVRFYLQGVRVPVYVVSWFICFTLSLSLQAAESIGSFLQIGFT